MEPWHARGGRSTIEGGREDPYFRSSFRELVMRPDWFSRITPASLRADLIAGLTGATLVLPQGVAFAAIAGLPPEYGFYSAMVPPVVAALLGSSWHAVSGPTTAISALVFGTLSGLLAPGSPEFIAAAITMALLVGLFQFALGLVRLGGIVDFVSHSVMTGFIAGAAMLIALSQLRHALHLDLPRPEELTAYFGTLVARVGETDLRAVIVAAVAIAVGAAVRWYRRTWPNYLIALVAATLASLTLGGAGTGLVTVGAIESVVPSFAIPSVGLGLVGELVTGALAIAMVGLLEAASVSRALAAKSGQQIDGNREFLGQGASNIVGSLFHCYPSSASFTRSGVNLDSGAETPLSSIFAALFLFLILLFVAPLFSVVPVAGMAGVIILVSWRLIDWGEIAHIVTTSRSETAIAGVTFASTLLVDLEFAIYAGVVMSLVLFILRIASPILGVAAPDPTSPSRTFRSSRLFNLKECPQLVIVRLDGPLYFGTAEGVRRELRRLRTLRPSQRHLLFMTSGVGEIDLPAAELLIEETRFRAKIGGSLSLKVLAYETIDKLRRLKVEREVGRERIHMSKRDAIAHIVPRLDPAICATCNVRIFKECPPPPSDPTSQSTGKI